MKERTLTVAAGILDLLLLAVCISGFLGKDRTPPEIKVDESAFVYHSAMSREELLERATALDETDGDLTERIVVEKIVTDGAGGKAAITYGVADRAGNVEKVTCLVETRPEREETPEAAVLPETQGSGEEQSLPEPEEEESTEEGTLSAEEESGEEGSREENEGEGSLEEETPETEEETPEGEALPTAGEAGNGSQTVGARPDPGRPTMVLKTGEVRVKAGTMPAWVQILEGLHDDQDDYATLLGTLQVRGEYDIEKAGSYEVTLTVTDREGNESNAYPVKMIVEE